MRALILRPLTATLLPLLLAACAGDAPRVVVPPELPAAYRHAPAAGSPAGADPSARVANTGAGWKPLPPNARAVSVEWWAPMDDARLAGLLRDAVTASPTVAQAEARWRQAQAVIGTARAGRAPRLEANLGATRSRGGELGRGSSYESGLALSWVPDLWGRVRGQVDAAQADAAASAADLAAAGLANQAALAQSYLRLRVLDRQVAIYDRTIEAYDRSLALTGTQYRAGFVARADVVQAETELETVRAERLATLRARTREEHAVAVLSGRAPAALRIEADGSLPGLPPAPSAVPSDLLVRRPDVASAERALAAAQARLGVARSAWLPDLTLSASGGLQADRFGDWLTAPHRVWSFGPALAATLLDGGARDAERARTEAVVDEQAARWRQAVLDAMQDVEDALADLASLDAEAAQAARVVALAEENERLVTNRYRSGLVSFLEVAVAQRTTLAARRSALEVDGTRLTSGVALVVALGGGWGP